MRAAIQGAARSRTHPPNRSANEHAKTGWSGKAISRSVSPSLKDWSWTGLSMTQASFFSAATSPGSTLSPSRCSCAKHFEVADRASSGTRVAGGAVCFDAAGGAVAFWAMSTGRRGGSGTAAAEAHPAVHAMRVIRREPRYLMWLAAISNVVQTGMPLHTSWFRRCVRSRFHHLTALRLAISPAGMPPRACTSRASFMTGGETPNIATAGGTRRKALDPSA
jgi:hypothetical protein